MQVKNSIMADEKALWQQSDPYGERIEAMKFDLNDERILKWIDNFWKFGQMDSKRNIRRQKAWKSGALLRSIKWRTWSQSGGNVQIFEAKYNYYAKFVELALGKNMPFKELPPGIPMRRWQPIAMPDRPRKAKPSIPTEMRKQARKFTTMLEDRYSYHGMAMMIYALGPSVKNQALIRHLLFDEPYRRAARQ